MSAAPHSDLAAHLGRLGTLDREGLAAAWIEVFGTPVPRKASRTFLLKAIAHHAQVKATRDVRPAVRKALLQLGRNLRDGTPPPSLPRSAPSLKPGSRLIRAWQGETHEVTVTSDGRFEWQGRRHRSLSHIATTITGTRRNGPAFFGLRETMGKMTAPPSPVGLQTRTHEVMA